MPSPHRANRLICAALPFLLWAGDAHAQRNEGVTVFAPADFAANAPVSALDMVRLIPGFTIIDADGDVRGYSGAQGNVQIDGAWPASKRDDIGELLRRIPVSAVERIELVRAGAGMDMGGHTLVVNVVRRRGANVEGAFDLGASLAANGEVSPQGGFELARRAGADSMELAFTAARLLDEDSGRGRIRTLDSSGAETGSSTTDALHLDDIAALSASLRRSLAGGRFDLTGALRSENEAGRELIGGAQSSLVREREKYLEAELGARYARALGATTLELIASQQLAWRDIAEQSEEGADSEDFRDERQSGETIGRIDIAHTRNERLTLTTSAEAAYNFLESAAALRENGVITDLPGSDVRVEEVRAEASIGANYRPRPGLAVQGDLRVEVSRIRQTGDTPLERDFVYAKPRLAVSWEADALNQFHFSISRDVGQLDFSDFVATASFAAGSVTAGNADLEPEQSWRYAIGWERRLWRDASLTLRYTRDEIDNTADRLFVVAADDVFDAPGNIGRGVRDTLQAEFAAPLAFAGLPHVRLTASGLWRASSVTDPATGERRGISDEPAREGDISVTYTTPRMILGLSYELAQRERQWRFDSIRDEQEAATWSVFAERRFEGDWRVRLDVFDPFGRKFSETRIRYDGLRGAGAQNEIERRSHTAPASVLISLRRNMGG